MRVSINEFAEHELHDAAVYYEHEQPGLGGAFIAEIERCAAGTALRPLASPILQGVVRRRMCARFPYAVLYSAAADEVRILAVMNLRRRPGYWVGRL